MDEEPRGLEESKFSQKVAAEAGAQAEAQADTTKTIWFGLGMSGLIGWSVMVPTLLGAALGLWLDKRYPSSYSWTLMLLLLGLIIGCWTSWHWIKSQFHQMHEENHE